ncbi:uncharacterized protein LOC121244283 [Juglans microcarpa x Juglans regia]|uniref:uncharacterized protein LOC121244283 n=1 Tax=Juglans microcarpa x Juglans regia TaxID=2249226 RepID=UPI001B7E66DE|nr:uncharacterized protein LOC121244283 [Juglans microcarpa x Juglans regia]
MVERPLPKSLKALKGFLGLTGHCRRFIKKYSEIVAPLTRLLKKECFHWSEEAKFAFQRLKEAVTQPPVLALLDFSLPLIIECDALGTTIGVVLMQCGRPIAFFSKALKGKSLPPSTYENELFALVSTQKWITKLLGYDFIVEYKKGSENRVANALSRKDKELERALMLITFPSMEWVEDLKRAYELDRHLKELLRNSSKGGSNVNEHCVSSSDQRADRSSGVGKVAYKLDLPSTSRIHHTFHVSQLKRKIGSKITAIPSLPPVDEQGVLWPEPEKVLSRRMVKARNKARAELLIRWHRQEATDATWEGYSQLKEHIPHLVGKVF